MDYFHLSVGQDILHPMSSLALAHLGDGVYELMVRTWLCLKGKATNKGLHRAAVTYVSAPAQAKRVKLILPILTEEEQDVYRRARNSHTAAIPKGASVGEYHAAWESTTPPPGWRPCSAGCTCRAVWTGSMSCLNG